jgi:hypothetical protein
MGNNKAKKDMPRTSRFFKRHDSHRPSQCSSSICSSNNHNVTSNQVSTQTATTPKTTCTYSTRLDLNERSCFRKQADLRKKANKPIVAAYVILVAAPIKLSLVTIEKQSQILFLLLDPVIHKRCHSTILPCFT